MKFFVKYKTLTNVNNICFYPLFAYRDFDIETFIKICNLKF